jgi:uncharacterized protein (TIGR03435 family)
LPSSVKVLLKVRFCVNAYHGGIVKDDEIRPTMRTVIASLLFAATAAAQTSFEVASIKPNNSGDGSDSVNTTDGSVVMRNVPLRMIIEDAYDLKRYALTAPDWLDNQRFDINARADAKVKQEELRLMLQSLLAERFQLKTHRESKEMSAYVLLPAKSGFKLKPAEGSGSGINSSRGAGKAKATCRHVSMARLADFLSGRVDHPVVDQSGIPDAYDFTLEWSPEQNTEDPGPSIFTALSEQLGLRLEPRKVPVSILVVDSISKMPTEN